MTTCVRPSIYITTKAYTENFDKTISEPVLYKAITYVLTVEMEINISNYKKPPCNFKVQYCGKREGESYFSLNVNQFL